ncbi:zinc finger BED domain-containing protein DAYSLEEPER-like isoform X1 [Senna tora]|uniref:Zinc finger BED domain-containing protein DAYSLEEPER-like isoform X1 n=1 Tax=Senna tora TaxID=362788 RepID=A0A834TR37_9FABA|nr:zinc finger BED domain-containing protein DAYSLEEPER-like isoform X1 [Senna tora]
MSPVTSNSAIEGSGDSGSIRSSSDDFFKRYLQFVRSKQEKKSELQRYLDERNLPLDSDFDILDFWSKGKWYPYPTLVRLARDILAIPILTMGSESAFCIKKKVVNPCNCSLSEKTIQALVCLEDWYPAKGLTLGGSGILGTPLDVESSSSDDDDNTKADVLAKISARNEQELQT